MKSSNHLLIAVLTLLVAYTCHGQYKYRLEVGFDPYMHYSDEDGWRFSRPVGFTPSFRFTVKLKKWNVSIGRHLMQFQKNYDYDTIIVQNQLRIRNSIIYQLNFGKIYKYNAFSFSFDAGLHYWLGKESRILYEDISMGRIITLEEKKINDYGLNAKIGLGVELVKSVELNIYTNYLHNQKSKLSQIMVEAMIGFSF